MLRIRPLIGYLLASVTSVVLLGCTRLPGSAGDHKGDLATSLAPCGGGVCDVKTQHNDNGSTGTYYELGFTPATFSRSRWVVVGALPVDGAVYAQPLYLHNVAIGGASHNVILIATNRNNIYAYDADDFVLLWYRHFADPDLSDDSEVQHQWETCTSNQPCPCRGMSPGWIDDDNRLHSAIGIQATTVIDRNSLRIYVAYRKGDPS